MTDRRIVFLLPLLALLAAMSGCSQAPNPWEGKGGPPRVVVTFPPLYSFVKSVGGDHVALVCLCTTKGPHEYEYDVQDLTYLRNADLFFANGLGLDDRFADLLEKNCGNPRLRYVKLGTAKRFPHELLHKDQDHDDKDADKHEEHGHEEHGHAHGEYDPHIWMGLEPARAMVAIIRDDLKAADPAHAADYEKNAQDYLKKLRDLEADGKKELADKKNRRLISFHESLGYFAHTFDLKVAASIEMAPGDAPTGATLGRLVHLCQDEKIRVIAVEPQYTRNNSAETLRKELQNKGVADVKLVTVDPLETAEPNSLNAQWYERQMRQNLDNLKRNLP